MTSLSALAEQHNLRIVEDCAQAHGAMFGGKKVGCFGDAAAFSFYPGKNLGAYGDAGAVIFADDSDSNKARMLANHGREFKYDHEFVGRNSRMDALQAAILRVKLQHLDEWLARRQAIAARYEEAIQSCLHVHWAPTKPNIRHARHLAVVETQHRDELKLHLNARGIETGIHYPIALPALAAYRDDHLEKCKNMNAIHLADQILSIPCHEMMTQGEVDRVISAIKDFDAHVSRADVQ